MEIMLEAVIEMEAMYERNEDGIASTVSVIKTGIECFDGIWVTPRLRVAHPIFRIPSFMPKHPNSLHPVVTLSSDDIGNGNSVPAFKLQFWFWKDLWLTLISFSFKIQSPLHYSNSHSWYRFCSPWWCSRQSIGIKLVACCMSAYYVSYLCLRQIVPVAYLQYLYGTLEIEHFK